MTKVYNCEGNGEVHLDVLKSICGDTSNKFLCDLCCGEAPQTRKLGFRTKHFVDIVKRDLGEDNCNFLQNMAEFHLYNLAGFARYDVITFLDAVEHFKKNIGYLLLDAIDNMAKLKIVFTPLGDYIIETIETDNPDSHKSGWLPKEFEDMGWSTIVFPNFHPTLNIGAFFAIKCDNLESEFERIINELNKKEWATH